MSNIINNSYKPSIGFILLFITFSLSSGIIYWSFTPNNIEVSMQLLEKGNNHVLKKEYKQAAAIYSQAAYLHNDSAMRSKFFLASANSANSGGNLNDAKNNLYLCFINYPYFEDSYILLQKLISQIKSDIEVANFINKIHTIKNFPLVELIKSANLRLALIKKDKNKEQFKKLLNPEIQDKLKYGPKPVFSQ